MDAAAAPGWFRGVAAAVVRWVAALVVGLGLAWGVGSAAYAAPSGPAVGTPARAPSTTTAAPATTKIVQAKVASGCDVGAACAGVAPLLAAGEPPTTAGVGVAANGAPAAERLFTSRAVGVDSKLLGNSYARGESGLLNRTGSRLKFGWTSSGEFGGGWHLRLGIGRSPLNPNQARFHWDFGSTHVPNSVANDLLDVLRGLNGL